MTFLSCTRKEDLKILADELGLVVGENFKIWQITELITKSENYDEVIVKGMLQVITEELKTIQKAKELAEEKERLEKDHKNMS